MQPEGVSWLVSELIKLSSYYAAFSLTLPSISTSNVHTIKAYDDLES